MNDDPIPDISFELAFMSAYALQLSIGFVGTILSHKL